MQNCPSYRLQFHLPVYLGQTNEEATKLLCIFENDVSGPTLAGDLRWGTGSLTAIAPLGRGTNVSINNINIHADTNTYKLRNK
jgi:hypothetical protein